MRAMRMREATRLMLTVSALALTPASVLAQQDGLALRRVLLSTGGVGYFEYEAAVSGDTRLTLDVPLDRVEDVLKSLVIYDDLGGVGSVSLPGREPLDTLFRDMPFGEADLGSPVSLLNALRGAEVQAIGSRTISGRVLSVIPEVQRLEDGSTITRHRLTLSTDVGFRDAILEEADAIAFADAGLQAQVNAALEALSAHSRRDRRLITVESLGEGERTVRVAYVAEAPLWKATYRMTVPDAATQGAEASLQGWAVIENFSGENWENVDLTLASGNPVTFRQALYEAYYVDRPEVPVEVLGRILPPMDKTAAYAMTEAAPAPMPMLQRGGAEAAMVLQDSFAPPPPAGTPRMAGVTAAAASEAATQALFHVPGTVTVAQGYSMMVPIIDRSVPAERLSLYQPSTTTLHPLASLDLENTTDSGLPPGVITLFERDAGGVIAYVGDARLGPLPAGESRLVSFAVDQKVRIDREDRGEDLLADGSLVDGVLTLTFLDRQQSVYTVIGAENEDRTIVLEHARPEGWTLAVEEGTATVERVVDADRLHVMVPAGETVRVAVALERPRRQTMQLLDLPIDTVALYAEANRLSDRARAAFAEVARLRAAVDAAERSEAGIERKRGELVAEQDRLRENLRAVPRDSDLHQRYLDSLAQQEDGLEALTRSLDDARVATEQARAALGSRVRDLTF